MSKELVISANRHETRVAILEDDQVVEVYHQRENEYSLAGSIHKGRVTRVLPGMQSAFVDIGLERDAFLYVSDFFEDNEEYDKIVTSVEDKVYRPPAAPVVVTAPVPATGEPAAEDAAPSLEAAAAPVAAPVAPPAVQEPRREEGRRDEARRDDRRGDGRDDRGRGRRGRRRRGPRGGDRRGLPDSKYYSPGPRAEGEPPARESYVAEPVAEPAGAQAEADDFFVLPGESLAKYTGGEEPGTGELETAGAEVDEQPAEFLEEPAAILVEEIEIEEVLTAAEPEPIIEPPVAETVSEIAQEPSPEPQPELMVAVEMVESELEPEPAEVEAAEVDESEPVAEATESEEGLAESAEAAEGAMDTAGETEGIVEEEGPEPARIPTSLTATLREQGPRFMHRVSRRTRRRGGRDGRDGRDTRECREAGGRGPQEPREPRDQREGETRNVSGPRPERERGVPPPQPRPERGGAPSISDLLKEGQEIIVQIAKEPLGQKGARITSHIALPGRFLVYMPTVDHIGVSRKIPSDEERLRLKRVLQTNRTGIPGGYIVRTAGDGRTEEELRADMMFLYNLWLDMRQKAERRPAPLLIHHDLNVVERVLRDQLTSAFKSVWVDNEETYENVLRFMQRFQPALVNRVKLYTRTNPIFDEFNITSELEKALRPKVWLKSGGYIVINQTEALVAIDINTGKFVGKSNRLEDTIVKTNTDAIKEIVRQIRLRDLGGIIVVDFIDMDERKNRQKVMQALEEAMRADRAPYKILQFNDFGLVAITRKRVKQSLERTLCMPCPYCEGAGYVKSAQTVVGEILQEANKIAKMVEGKDVMLRVAPDVARLLKSNHNTFLQELEEILGRTVIVKGDPQLHLEKFDLA